MNRITYQLKDFYKQRKMLVEFSKLDFKEQFLGSYLGIGWAFLNPIIMIGIFWFVFEVGFKSQPIDNAPFILWLVAGIVPWFFFSSALNAATNSIVQNAHLVQKIIFKVSLIPMIKIISNLFVHLIFIGITLGIFLFYQYGFQLYYLQVFYYLFATLVLLIGLSYITASIMVFTKDMSPIINMILQFGFWLTPIFWSTNIVPEKFHTLLKLNPLFYIVEGYRCTFIYKTWFWEYPYLTLYFWVVTISIFIFGVLLFKRLRPHFADVL